MNAKRARPALAVASSPRPVLDSRWFPLNRVAAGVRAVCLSTAGVMIGLQPGTALAGPQGGAVVAGQGSINRPDANTTLINQSSHHLALDWRSFDVARNELVRFQQPGATATALNRIFDQKPSQIYGRVQANGQIYLVNPNGVYFGPSARLAVGGLVAAGAKIDVDDFMAGNYRLDTSADSDGIVINQGVIEAATGGSVALIGKAVSNEGVIVANAGRVNLVAGSKVALDFDGDGLMRFTVDEAVLDNARALDAAVSNTGTVQADGGEIILHASVAKNVFDQAINNSGVIKAARIDNAGGTIRLVGAGPQAAVLNTGTLAADGIRGSGGRVEVNADGTLIAGSGSRISARGGAGTGGAVHLLGERVGLGGDAAVDVSGLNGGGEILAGGDFQGANAAVRNAAQTFVGAGVTLTADAIVDGDGGKVIVWSDQATRYYAAISARGGATGGDGGSVEVSGKELLAFDGGIDTGATHGRSGQILLDPRDIDITDATTTDNAQLNANVPNGGDPAGEILFANDKGGGANVDDFTVSDEALESLTGNITLQANRDIKVNAGLSGGLTLTNQGNGETVTFRAGRDVRVDSAITTSGASIAFTADDDSATGGFGGAGKIDINAQVSTAGAAGVVGNINLTVQGGTGDIDLGADLRTAGGSVTLSGPVTISAATVTIDTDLAGGATAAGNVNMGTSAINAATGAETLVVNATADGGGGGGTVSLGAVGGATRLAALTVSGAALTLNGDLRVNGGGNVDLSGATAVTLGANVVIDTDAVAGTTAAGGILFGSTAVNGAFTLTLDTSADSADANENAGNITLGTTGGGTALAALTVDTRGKGTGTNGTLTLNGDVRTDGGNIDLQNALDIELAGAGATITLDTESGNDGNAGAVIFAAAGDLDSATTRNLVIDATSTGNNAGDVTLGRIGASNRIGTLTVAGNDISFGADVESGAISASTAAGADADSISVAAVTLDANGGALTFSADDIAINAGAVLTSTGAGAGINATLRGRTAATSIGIGDNAAAGATLDLAASELQTIAGTFKAIVVGTITTQSGTITVDETGGLSGLNTSLVLRADAGDVVIASAIDMSATAGAGFSVKGDGNTTTLAGNITTAGGIVTLDDTLLVDGTRTIDTTAGNTANAGAVTITGAIDGANAAGTDTLTIDAARDAVDGTGDANVSLQGAVEGGAGAVTVTGGQDLESLVITGAQVTAVNIRVTGALSLTGTQLNLAGTSYQSDDGAITLTGPVDLTGAGTVTLDSDADNDATDGAITITGAVTDTGSNSGLTVDADTAQVDLGNVTVNGALAVTGGNIDLNGTVYTSVTDNVTFTGAVDLDAGAVTTTVTGGGGVGDTVTFSTNVNDAGNDTTLKIVGGAGGVALNGAVGNTGALQALVVDSAATVVLNAVTVGNGGINVGAVTPVGTSITLNGALKTDATANAGNVRLAGPVVLGATVSIDTDAATTDGNVTFTGAVNAAGAGVQGLTLVAGGGNVAFNGAVGGGTRLGVLTVTSANNVTADLGVTAASILQSAGTGTTTFTGAVNTNAAAGLDLDGAAFTFSNTVTTSAGGTVTITNGGLLTLAAAAGMTLDGAFLQDGAGAVSTGADIGTSNDAITFTGATTLTGNVALDTGAGAGSVSFNGTLNGTADFAQALTITAGTGDVGFNNLVGTITDLGDIVIASGRNLTLDSGTVAIGVDASATPDTFLAESLAATTLSGDVVLGGTAGDGGDIVLRGQGVTNALDLKTTTGSSDAILIAANVLAQNGNVRLEATANGADIRMTVTGLPLTGNATVAERAVQTTAGNITTLVGGGGARTRLNDAKGGGTAAAPTSGQNTVLRATAGAVSADSVTTGNAILDSSFPQIIANAIALDFTDHVLLGDDAIFARITANVFDDATMDGFLGAGTTLSISTTGGDIVLDRAVQFKTGTGAENLTLVTDQLITDNGTGVAFQSTGTLTLTSNGTIGLDNTAGTNTDGTLKIDVGALVITSTGGNSVHVTDTGTGGNTSYAVATGAGGDITLVQQTSNMTVGGLSSTTGAIALTAGTGTIRLTGSSYAAGTSLTLSGPVDLVAGGTTVSFTSGGANAINVSGAITDTGSDDALTVNAGAGQVDLGNVTVNGALAVTGGNIDLNGTVYTSTTDDVTFTGAVDLDAGAVTTTVTGGGGAGDTVTFSTNVNDAGNDTTLKVVGGASGGVALNGAVGNTGALQALVVDSAATVVLNAVTVGNGGIDVGAVTPVGTSITLNGALKTDATANAGNVRLAGPVVLGATVSIDTDAATTDGNVTFTGAVNAAGAGVQGLTLVAGGGNVTFNGAVGGGTRLGVLTVTSANNVTADLGVTAASILQSAGTGTTTFTGAVNTNAAAGLDLDGAAFTFSNTVTTSAGGTVTITNSGLLTLAAAADMTLTGAFLQNGAGAVSTGADIGTSNDAITFTGATTLTGNVALNTGTGAGSVSFNGTLNGTADFAQDLTITAGTGDVLFNANVGTITDLGDVDVTSAGALTVNSGTVVIGRNEALTPDTFLAESLKAVTTGVITLGGVAGTGGDIILRGTGVTNTLDLRSTSASDPAILIRANVVAQNGDIVLEVTANGSDITFGTAGLPNEGDFGITGNIAERSVEAVLGNITTLVGLGNARTRLLDSKAGGSTTIPIDGKNTVVRTLGLAGTISLDGAALGTQLDDTAFRQIISAITNITLSGHVLLGTDAAGARAADPENVFIDSAMDGLLAGGTTLIISTTGGDIVIDRANPDFVIGNATKNLTLATDGVITDNSAGTALKTSGTLTLTSGGTIGLDNTAGTNTDGTLKVDVGTLVVTSSNGSNIHVTDVGTTSTTYNVVTGGAGGNVTLVQQANDALVNQINAGGTVSITATTGSILDHADDAVADLTAGGLITLTAAGNIAGPGPGDAYLDLAAGSSVTAASSSGLLRLRGLGATTVGVGGLHTNGGLIDVTSAGTFNDGAETIEALGGGSGTVAVTTTGAAADVMLSGQIMTNDAAVTITSNRSITLGAISTGVVTPGALLVTVDNDNNSNATLTLTGTLTVNNATSLLKGHSDGAGTGDTLQGADIVNTWNITGSGTLNGIAFNDFDNLSGGSLADTFNITTGTVTGTINGGTGGTDTISYAGGPATTVVLTALGSSHGFAGTATATGGFNNIDVLIGGAGSDSLQGRNAGATWTLDGTPQYTSANVLDFSGFESLIGGSGIDVFDVTANTTMNLSGGGGNDQFTIENNAVLTGNIDGGTGDDTVLVGTNIATDTAHIVGSVNGGTDGGGPDFDTLSWVGSMLSHGLVTTAAGTSHGTQGSIGVVGTAIVSGTFDNIDNLVGNGQGPLLGPATDTYWEITGVNAGRFSTLVNGAAGPFTTFANFSIQAQGGTDYFVLTAAGRLTGGLGINGGLGTNTLQGSLGNDAYNWSLTGSNSGTVTNVTGVTSFSNIDVIVGSAGVDDITIATGVAWIGDVGGAAGDDVVTFQNNATLVANAGEGLTGKLDGGPGADSINWSAYASARNVVLSSSDADGFDGTEASIAGGFLNVDALTATALTDSLTGQNAVATWGLDGTDTYTVGAQVLDFTAFENLTGGSLADVFAISASHSGDLLGGGGDDQFNFTGAALVVSGIVNGNTGDDTMSFVGYAPLVTVQILGPGPTDELSGNVAGTIGGGWRNIGGVTGEAGDALQAPNTTNNWVVTAVNVFSLDAGAGISNAGFVGFNSLLGGTGIDNFFFETGGQITGGVDGGLGTNTVNGSDSGDIWAINSATGGTITTAGGQTTFANVSNINTATPPTGTGGVVGGDGADVFNLNANFGGIIAGNGGADVFNANLFGALSLQGGSGDDILNGGNVARLWTITGMNQGTLGTTAFTGIEKLVGGTNTDAFQFNGAGVQITGIGGVGVDGGTGVNGIQGTTGIDTFNLTGNHLGSLVTAGNATSFVNIDDIAANDGNDVVNLAAAAVFTTVLGGQGNDTFNLSDGAAVTNPIDGGIGNDTVVGGAAANTWTLNSATGGTVVAPAGANVTVAFTDMESVIGGAGNDTVTATALFDGRISGGLAQGENDTFDISAMAGSQAVQLTSAAAGLVAGSFNVFNFETLAATPADNQDTLTGANIVNNWSITSLTGNGSVGDGDGTGTVAFSGFNVINGGTAADTLSAPVAGLPANTIVSFVALGLPGLQGVLATLNTATLTPGPTFIAFNGMETLSGSGASAVVGSSGADNILINGANAGRIANLNIAFNGMARVAGNSGDDTITLAPGGSVSVGITGSDGNDILVAGTAGANVWTITGSSAGTLNGNAFTLMEVLRSGTGNDEFSAAGASFGGTVQVQGDDVWHYSDGVRLAAAVTTFGSPGSGSLTVIRPAATPVPYDVVVDAAGLNLPDMTGFTGHTIIGGTLTPPTLPITGATQAQIHADFLTVNSNIEVGGDLTLLAGDIEFESGVELSAGGEGGATFNAIAGGNAVGGTGNGDINAFGPVTIKAGKAVLIAANDIVNSNQIALALGGGEVQVAVGPTAQDPQFDVGNSDATGVDLSPDLLAFASNLNIDAQGVLVVFSNPGAALAQLAELGFVDISVFEQELELIGQIGFGIAMSLDQCEELEGCGPSVTAEEVDGLITGIEARIAELERRKAEGSEDPARVDELIAGFRSQLERFTELKGQLEAYKQRAAQTEFGTEDFGTGEFDEGGEGAEPPADEFDDGTGPAEPQDTTEPPADEAPGSDEFQDELEDDFDDGAQLPQLPITPTTVSAWQWIEVAQGGPLYWSGDTVLAQRWRLY